jgi:type IV pilus assembly protein PilA
MNRKGFTLIELLIVVVIIGILAAIAIPKFANTKQKAYLASMKTDLRNLVTAQEAYFADSVKYATSVCSTSPCSGALFTTTTGNVLGAVATTGDGWTASITNINMTGTNAHTCAIFIGSTSLAPATKEGEPKCN